MKIDFIKTICPYCGCGCGIILEVVDGNIVKTLPDKDHPVSRGQLCIKGWNAHEFVHHPDRLTSPLLKGKNGFQKIPWEQALDIAAEKLKAAADKYGPDAVAGLSSARVSNEENYLFQKLIRTGFSTNNVDHCARLCHGPTAAAMARALGSGAMTNSIDDFVGADLIIMFGSNAAETHPIIMGKIYEARAKGATLIVVDPRRTEPAKNADFYLPINFGADIPLINGMMGHILDNGLEDSFFVTERTQNFEAVKKNLASWPMDKAVEISGIGPNMIAKVAQLYAKAKSASIVFCMGITQHSCGTANVHAICNLAMLCGQVGRQNAGINPLRGQNNVQGSCDMGALPNLLPGYQDVTDPGVRSKFEASWKTCLPSTPGLTVTEMTGQAGDNVKAIYIMAENPMMSDPDINHVRERLKKLDFLMVQDIFLTETAQLADLVLPGACFAEKTGTFTNTERRVQLLRKAVLPPGEAVDDFTILNRLAQKLNLDFDYKNPEEVMDELATLVPIYGGINFTRLESAGLQWPCPSHDHQGTSFLHKDNFSRGKGLFVVPDYTPPREMPDPEYPLVLVTGRMFCHYHTGTMTRRSKTLSQEAAHPFAQIHPDDALALNISQQDSVRVSTRRGSIVLSARLTRDVRPGSLFIPFHFAEAPANALTHEALDPVSKIPEFKACAAKLAKEESKEDRKHDSRKGQDI